MRIPQLPANTHRRGEAWPRHRAKARLARRVNGNKKMSERKRINDAKREARTRQGSR